MASGRRLLTVDNLSCLSQLVSDSDDVQAFDEYLKALAGSSAAA